MGTQGRYKGAGKRNDASSMSRADLSPTKLEPDGTLQGCVCQTSVPADDIVDDQTIVNVGGVELVSGTLYILTFSFFLHYERVVEERIAINYIVMYV